MPVGVHSTLTSVVLKQTHIACRRSAIKAVPTLPTRSCVHATHARAGTLVRRAHRGYDDFVDVLTYAAIKRPCGALNISFTPLLFEYFFQDLSCASYTHLFGCRRSSLTPSLHPICGLQACTHSSFSRDLLSSTANTSVVFTTLSAWFCRCFFSFVLKY